MLTVSRLMWLNDGIPFIVELVINTLVLVWHSDPDSKLNICGKSEIKSPEG